MKPKTDDERIKSAVADLIEKLSAAVSSETGGACFVNFSLSVMPHKDEDENEPWRKSLRDDD